MANWTIPDELKQFLGLYAWEGLLGEKDLYRLAVSRSFVTEDDVNTIALEHARVLSSSEFHDSLNETKDDPAARAVVRLKGALDSYPFRVNWNANTPEEMGLVGGLDS